MTTWFVTRHPGARDWARRRGLAVDCFVEHFDPAIVRPSDIVIGTLPVNLIASICTKGCRYMHLTLELSPELRGRELSADELEACNAHLTPYLATELKALGKAES